MELPFTIKFFKKLEYYQDLKRLDKIASKQKAGKTKNTWDIEKKVLRWTYSGHKHLGSPILIQHFFEEPEARRRQFAYLYNKWMEDHKNELKELVLINSKDIDRKRQQMRDMFSFKSENGKLPILEIEKKFKPINDDKGKKRKTFDKDCYCDYNFKEKVSKISGDCDQSFCLSDYEKSHAKKEVRNILKSLVVKGFARFLNEKDEEDGVIISEKGLLMGEVINECIKIDKNKNIYPNKISVTIYGSWIILGWLLVLIVVVIAISSIIEKFGLLDNLKNSVKSILHYNNFVDIYLAWIFLSFIFYLTILIIVSWIKNL
ncbi:MAG: hypothetical protein ACD_58C00042G0006 [uncultured bacterium]|nr:MAG: hypothetical protein ACD_58C00042G0006 [uncultured bacterium]